ncbi:MAG TPA: hypothetical protein VLJ18_10740 [Thermoanaerobaculia bacterium]|nr:hypothetical protein [Thermoanaerobaculia bacterium]
MPTFNTREEYEAWKAARAAGAAPQAQPQAGPPPVVPQQFAPPPPAPLPPYDARQQILDVEHLRLLRLGYIVAACVSSFVCVMGFFYVGMGALVSSTIPARGTRGAPPFSPFAFFAVFGAIFVVVGAVLVVLNVLTARAIGRRRGYVLCMVSAALSCLGIPYGTLLGIATFIVLGRPHVKAMFEGAPAPLSA